MYMLDRGAPFSRDKKGRVCDAGGEEVRLLGDTMAIFKQLASEEVWQDVTITWVSRTEYPEWYAGKEQGAAPAWVGRAFLSCVLCV